MLSKQDQIGLVALSDGRTDQHAGTIANVKQVFLNWGLTPVEANTIYQKAGQFWSGTPEERAHALMDLFTDSSIKAIFDLSGGDSANQILPYLDYQTISKHSKPFFGYSDLTVILNSLFSQSGLTSYHYQAMHLVGRDHLNQQNRLHNLLFHQNDHLTFNYNWINQGTIEGITIGGNIRCLLKLAGTPYLPVPFGKVLFLESRSGRANRIASFLAQLDQINYFSQLNGLILGQFTELEEIEGSQALIELIKPFANKYNLPTIKTSQLGHSADSHILAIGKRVLIPNKHP